MQLAALYTQLFYPLKRGETIYHPKNLYNNLNILDREFLQNIKFIVHTLILGSATNKDND